MSRYEALKFKEEGQDTWREFILFMDDHDSEDPKDQSLYLVEYETRYVVLGFRCGRYGTERQPQATYHYPGDEIREKLVEMFAGPKVERSIGDLYLLNDEFKEFVGDCLAQAKADD